MTEYHTMTVGVWIKNPHPLKRKIPGGVEEWFIGALGRVDVRADDGREYLDVSPVMTFVGPQVFTHFRLMVRSDAGTVH